MYKGILRNVLTGPNTSLKNFGAFLFAPKCHKSPTAVFRLANTTGAKGLRTCSIKLCEKSEEVSPPEEDRIGSADNKSAVDAKTNPDTETPNKNSLLAEASNSDKTTALLSDDDSAAQSNCVVEPVATRHEKVMTGKQGLLDLLGAMKVVIKKRKFAPLFYTYGKRDPLENTVHMSGKAKVSISTPNAKIDPLENTVTMSGKATEKMPPQSETLAPELVAAASAAASTLPNPIKAESELLQQLRQHETITETQKKGEWINIGDILAEMKIRKNVKRVNTDLTSLIRLDDDGHTYERGITGELASIRKRKNLFREKRLTIFSPSDVTVEPTDARPTLWDMDFASQLSTVTGQTPRNGFEEMIQWTHQGKLWKYPIDNDAGLEDEASVPFHEHIFLEKHLEDGFPLKGPIRHFMELVINGLSKNPHLTVQQKKDHIFWFREYFCQKEEILKEDDVHLN